MGQIKLSDNHTAESLKHYDMHPGDIFLADAGYGTAANYVFSQEHKGDVTLRISPNQFPIYDLDGNKIKLLPLLSQAKKKGFRSFEITGYTRYQKQFHFVRLVIGNIPEEKVEKIRRRKRRKAQKDGHQAKKETMEYAGFTFLATSLGKEYDREEILSIYRSRWQVELLKLAWSLFINPKDIFLLEHYLSTHESRRKNQNRIFHSEVLGTLIA